MQYELTKLNEISKKLAYVMKKVYINYRIKRVKGDNFGMFFQNCLFLFRGKIYESWECVMDKIDKKLITLLQQDARMPLKALAENVFLSSPAVSARIERLEKEQIIEGYEVKVNQLKLGYHITAFINLEVAPVQKPDFYPFIKSCHNVVECNCVTGNYSMLLKVVFPSTMELDTFIGQLQKFGRTSTQIVFSTPVEPRGIDVNVELPVND